MYLTEDICRDAACSVRIIFCRVFVSDAARCVPTAGCLPTSVFNLVLFGRCVQRLHDILLCPCFGRSTLRPYCWVFSNFCLQAGIVGTLRAASASGYSAVSLFRTQHAASLLLDVFQRLLLPWYCSDAARSIPTFKSVFRFQF